MDAAVRKDIERLARIDPRVSVSLDYVSGTKHYTFQPKASFAFKLRLPQSQVDKVRELHEFGRPLDLCGKDLVVEDFLLFEELLKSGEPRFSFTPSDVKECDFEVWCPDPDSDLRFTMPGKVSRGTSGLLFVGEMRGTEIDVGL